ncbi:hypothetical protein [Lelliottia wanjuensis]|uniref:hypothetical protein n=1 Tax=Lelliottia wanjuensis TaxID=3050585 RepID=UPI00254D4603|nr:hypothetical protein [Lelliottia sp. V104_15]MDK9605520.1 hypothetical protein [Lelliottia sp. V104_15]
MISNAKPVLLSGEQMDAILSIQRQERSASPLGVAPSLNAIARALVKKGLEAMAQEKSSGSADVQV